MRQFLIALLISVLELGVFQTVVAQSTAPNTKSGYNFDFEYIENGMPSHWQTMGDTTCTFFIDSINKKEGNYSAVIESHGNDSKFGAWGIVIPHSFTGKTITLSGYMKTENVEGSHAGLWMRMDPNAGFDNMAKQQIKGTTDWQKYTISLPLSSEMVQQIVVGGLLVGKGKIWIDNLKLQVDNKDIELIMQKVA